MVLDSEWIDFDGYLQEHPHFISQTRKIILSFRRCKNVQGNFVSISPPIITGVQRAVRGTYGRTHTAKFPTGVIGVSVDA